MQTKVKSKNQKTKIFALLLVLLLSVCCVLFAGCAIVAGRRAIESGSGGSGGSGNQSAQFVPNKFKLGYRGTGTDEEAKNNISDLSKELVEDFASTYGAGKGFGENQNDMWYDSIRYQVELGKNDDDEDYVFADLSHNWLWSSNNLPKTPYRYIQKEGKPFEDYSPNTYYEAMSGGKKRVDIYREFYSKLYSQSMEVVLYEILLGRTDFQNMIVIGNEFDAQGYPQISYRGKSVAITDGKPNFDTILGDLQAEYFDKTTYFGFSVTDGAKIKNYIINHVIGSKALSDKDGNDQLNNNRNYRAYVEKLVDGKINSETKYYWYSRTAFEDSKLAISSTEDYFQLVPKAEYQSLVLMAEEADEFSSCWIAFQSERDLKINMYYRYFDGQTIRTTAPKTISVKGGAYDMIGNDSSVRDFGTDNGYFAIDVFDNNDFVAAPTARTNNPDTKIYNPIASKNGFGCVSVFNGNNVNNSFLEIVLDVEKNAYDPIGTDYSFQVALFGLVLKSDIDAGQE